MRRTEQVHGSLGTGPWLKMVGMGTDFFLINKNKSITRELINALMDKNMKQLPE